MKNIALIGCTGSIGRQAIKVAARYPDKFRIVAMAANTGGEAFVRQAAEVRPAFAALRQEGEAVPVPAGTRFARGESAFEEACSYADADVVLVAVTGFAGLKAALLAIAAGKDIALANKESLVAGGDLVMRLAAEKGVNVLPVDSEHSAVWQCLHFDRKAPFPASCSRRAAAPCETCLLQSFLRSRRRRRSPTRTGIWAQRSP